MCDIFCNSLRIKDDRCPVDNSYGYRILNSDVFTCHRGHHWKVLNGEKIVLNEDIRHMTPSPFIHAEFPSTIKMIRRNKSENNFL